MFRGTDDIVLEGAVTKACAHDVVAAATRIDDFILFNNIAILCFNFKQGWSRCCETCYIVVQMGSNRKRISEQKIM